MAALSFTYFPLRVHSTLRFPCSVSLGRLQALRLQNKGFGRQAASKNKMGDLLPEELSNEEASSPKRVAKTRKGPARTRKKKKSEIEEGNHDNIADADVPGGGSDAQLASSELGAQERTRNEASSSPTRVSEEKSEKGRKRKKTKQLENLEHQRLRELTDHEGHLLTENVKDEGDNNLDTGKEESIEFGGKHRKAKKKTDDQGHLDDDELDDHDGFVFTANMDDQGEEDLELGTDGEEDISFTYGWPPLVCCFGAAQHAFVPSGRRANRLLNYKIHERLKDAMWTPENFVRAPGGCAGSVAVALAHLGGKVAFMGKLGDDDFGQTMLYYMNAQKVQTRSVCVDNKQATAVSRMKISKRGNVKMACVQPCAEDSLRKSEVNIDVLKEAKILYFNTSSLIDENMRKTVLKTIRISKRFGGLIFYDVNLPLPLWHSSEETKMFIQQAMNLADIVEVTRQELEFLCGITPFENFDTRDNDKWKFVHYTQNEVAPLWHEDLKLLFVTNGTSKIHYYTKEHNNAILGMEDPPLTPFTCDMSASGDSIVAALMRMLSVQLDRITDPGYLEHAIKYAIDCGVIDQWLLARRRGYPPREGMEEEIVPDLDGIRSITEREFRTVKRV